MATEEKDDQRTTPGRERDLKEMWTARYSWTKMEASAENKVVWKRVVWGTHR